MNTTTLKPIVLASITISLIALNAPRAAAQGSFEEFDKRARAGEKLSVVFFGASLTWGANASDPNNTSYRASVGRRLEEKYPQAHFHFWDAAIGGTGSQLGAFRLERDVLRRKPDLVFLDFSANDNIYTAAPESLASYEALVRRLVTEGRVPVVQVIFPFRWDVEKGNTDGMLRRDAHLAISAAYHTGLGDAITLAQSRVKSGETTNKQIWPYDGVHPGNAGYELFADAAWQGFLTAVDEKRQCQAPEKMLYAPTYMHVARVKLSSLGALPAGWKVDHPNLTSAYYDMLMCRWLDDETVATHGMKAKAAKPAAEKKLDSKSDAKSDAKSESRADVKTYAKAEATADAKSDDKSAASASPPVESLRLTFRGSMVLLFGESTPKSAKYHALIDGKLVELTLKDGKKQSQFDPGQFAQRANGNVHHNQILADDLDPNVEHTLEIIPDWDGDTEQELRLESICVAGSDKPEVRLAK